MSNNSKFGKYRFYILVNLFSARFNSTIDSNLQVNSTSKLFWSVNDFKFWNCFVRSKWNLYILLLPNLKTCKSANLALKENDTYHILEFQQLNYLSNLILLKDTSATILHLPN